MSENHDAIVVDAKSEGEGGGCPVAHGRAPHPTQGGGNREWWPERLNLKILAKNPAVANPLGEEFDYAEAFKALDLPTVKQDIAGVLTTSQDWWPADFGHYGPFIIRMAWHSAGTYRISDGRGGAGAGQQRFAPLNSWPDNGNLDKARRLLWPVKKKYGQSLSWADLMILAGNVALETMGFETFGFAGGRADVWEPEEDVYWGPEKTWLGDERYTGDRNLESPLGAVQMGLIYVNPEGPNGSPDPLASARDIRETFRRMAMNDEETVALVAGGHTFGKTHGAGPADSVGADPEAAPIEQQGFGWKNSHGTGKGGDTITSGLEGIWTNTPITWDNSFFEILFGYEWELFKSPRAPTSGGRRTAPGRHRTGRPRLLEDARPDDAHDRPRAARRPVVRGDLAPLPRPPRPVRGRLRPRLVQADPPRHGPDRALPRFRGAVRDAGVAGPAAGRHARARRRRGRRLPQGAGPGFRSVGVAARVHGVGLGLVVPRQRQARRRQRRPCPPRTAERLGGQRPRPPRGGAADARRHPGVLQLLPERRQARLVRRPDRACGCRGCREGRRGGGLRHRGALHAGRADATQEQTDVESFAALEPVADGFRNYLGKGHRLPAEYLLIDRANLLTLSAPELTVLVGGLRVLGANYQESSLGVLTDTPGTLTNDFFVNLLDLGTTWTATSEDANTFEARDTATGDVKWTGSRADLVFGSNSELRAVAEVYASDDAKEKFVKDFVAAWTKVSNLDRFDLV